jgi:hypothetical protein
VRAVPTILEAEQSAALRDQLLADVAQLQSADRVPRNLPAKNKLMTAASNLVENAFRDRLDRVNTCFS